MGRLLNRFRKWLIRKLGGYVEQIFLPPPTINFHQITPTRLSVKRTFYIDDLAVINNDELIRAAMLSLMVKEIFDQQLVTILRSDDAEPGAVTFRAEVSVLPPYDLGGDEHGA